RRVRHLDLRSRVARRADQRFCGWLCRGWQGTTASADGARAELRGGPIRWPCGGRPGAHPRAGNPTLTLTNEARAILLQIVLWLPLVGAVVVALWPANEENPLRSWRISTFFATLTMLAALWLMIGFDRNRADQFQFATRIAWLPFGSDYRIAVDGLSMP